MITNDHYYRALNIMNRVEEIRQKLNIPKTEFGKKLGYTPAYYYAFYNSCRTIKVSTLIKFAEILNVSVNYLLTGKNYEQFKNFTLNYDNIINSKKRKTPNSLKVIKTALKYGKIKDLNIKSLFEFEEQLHIPAIKLIGGE